MTANIKSLEYLDHLIEHEQGQFDLAEYQARLVNKAILNVEDKLKVNEIYRVHINQLDSLRRLYNKETNRGMNEESEKIWRNKINKMMDSVTGQ